MVMELCDGSCEIARPLTESQAAHVVKQLLRAVAKLHAGVGVGPEKASVLHRCVSECSAGEARNTLRQAALCQSC